MPKDANGEDSDYAWASDEVLSSSDEDENSDSDDFLMQHRSILWLCQEGQIRLARLRFESLSERGNSDSEILQDLKNEVYHVGRDKNYPLHELLMGGTSDRNAYDLTMSILEFSEKFPMEHQKMLAAKPPSHGRTPLHWAAWSNAKLEILQALVRGYPEALILRDKKSQGERTPLEILKRYFVRQQDQDSGKIPYLERATASWTSQRVRLAVSFCTYRYFAPPDHNRQLVPFNNQDRKSTGIKPRPWFCLSVLGFLVQREMKPLALRITSFVGYNAKVTPRKRSSGGKRKHNAT